MTPESATAHNPSDILQVLSPEYRAMVAQRVLEERAVKLQRQGRLGFYIGGIGQEAPGAAAALALRPDDWIVPSYRSPAFALIRGVSLSDMIHQCYGTGKETTQGRQMPCHYSFKEAKFLSISSPLGTQIVQAAGVGMAAKIKGDDTVVLVDFGEGSTSENDFHTGLNFAGVFNAPVIFFCQNNQWAISTPYERQTAAATIADKAVAYGMPGVRCDGNDALAVEAVTYRVGSHSSSDDWTKYRGEEAVNEWLKKDPIDRFRAYLTKRGDWDDAAEQAMRDKINAEIDDAVKDAESTPPPSISSMFQDVYHELPAHLVQQRDALIEEQKETQTDRDESMAFPL
ncbi:MAG: thiamine pyrophosphate-dependent dehydrogenase E1 component subunit alpha [Planctomycetota bacterium]|jgi:2-oxoisovalerate dehydrogenase E1 component alpha subunit